MFNSKRVEALEWKVTVLEDRLETLLKWRIANIVNEEQAAVWDDLRRIRDYLGITEKVTEYKVEYVKRK